MNRARLLMLQLMVEDQAAYEALTAARKLPETSKTRQSDFDVSLLASIRVPQAMGATALAMIDLADKLVDKVNHYLLSDLAVCCELSMATIRCAIYNVRANLPDLTDSRDRTNVTASADHLLQEGTRLIQKVIPRIWSRQAQSST